MYHILVVELGDVVPRRCDDKPNLYVEKTAQSPDQRILALQEGRGPEWLKGNVVRLCAAHTSGPIRSAESATTRLKDKIRRLGAAGYTVNRSTRVWTVYVIELDPAGVKDPGKGYVYVGETTKTPEARLQEHRTDARTEKGRRLASRVVWRHGRNLRMDLAPKKKYFDAESAKLAEKRWHQRLKALGYKAVGGH